MVPLFSKADDVSFIVFGSLCKVRADQKLELSQINVGRWCGSVGVGMMSQSTRVT